MKYRMVISIGKKTSVGYFKDLGFAIKLAKLLGRNPSVKYVGVYLDGADGITEYYCYDKEGA
jgi:hypothetical protein